MPRSGEKGKGEKLHRTRLSQTLTSTLGKPLLKSEREKADKTETEKSNQGDETVAGPNRKGCLQGIIN